MNKKEVMDEYFYAVIDRMKAQGALPHESFLKEIPFFSFSDISKEAQVKELFHDICNPQNSKAVLNTIMNLIQNSDSSEVISKHLSSLQMMNFAQIVLYKTLPCSDGTDCPYKPREIATHNQYKDHEYHCPFYHHERDRRRLVITPEIDAEFAYKANYFEEGRKNFDKDKYSQNYFESMFHPLYYKMFRCKREYCKLSPLCPFYHSEEEKRRWDGVFLNYVNKDRINYVKDKKKYFENPSATRAQNREMNERSDTGSDSTPKSNETKRNTFIQRGEFTSPGNINFKNSYANNRDQKAWINAVKNNPNWRKDSNESLEEFKNSGFAKYNGSNLPISRNA